MSENKDLILIDSALQDFDKISAGFALLEKNYKGVLYDTDETIGMEHAKAARAAIREPRYRVEQIRKSAKAPLLAIGKKLDAEAARLTGSLLELEEPIHAQIKQTEERVERERLARAQAELERRTRIEARIQDIRNTVVTVANLPADAITQRIVMLRDVEINEGFEEFQQQAVDAKTATLSRLVELRDAATEREAEKARIAAEREELAKLRAEQADRDRLAREAQAKADADAKVERDRLEAIAKAERDAEAARQAEANRLERERIAKEEADAKAIRDIEAKRLADERAENERIARERQADLDAQAETQRQALAEEAGRIAADRARLEADQEAARKAAEPKPDPPIIPRSRSTVAKTPDREQIIDVIATHFDVHPNIARYWLGSIRWTEVA